MWGRFKQKEAGETNCREYQSADAAQDETPEVGPDRLVHTLQTLAWRNGQDQRHGQPAEAQQNSVDGRKSLIPVTALTKSNQVGRVEQEGDRCSECK